MLIFHEIKKNHFSNIYTAKVPIHTDDVASGLVITQYNHENNQMAGRPISQLHCLLSNLCVIHIQLVFMKLGNEDPI